MNTPRHNSEKHIPTFHQVYDLCIIDYKKMRAENLKLSNEDFLVQIFIEHIKSICSNNSMIFKDFFTKAKEQGLLNFKAQAYKRSIEEYRIAGATVISHEILQALSKEQYNKVDSIVDQKHEDKITLQVKRMINEKAIDVMKKKRVHDRVASLWWNAFDQNEEFKKNSKISDKQRLKEQEERHNKLKIVNSWHFSENLLVNDSEILETFSEAVTIENLSWKLDNPDNLTEEEVKAIQKEKEFLAESWLDIDALMFDEMLDENPEPEEVDKLTDELKIKLESIVDETVSEYLEWKFYYKYEHFIEILKKTRDENNTRDISEEISSYFINWYINKLIDIFFKDYLDNKSCKSIKEFSFKFSWTDKLEQEDQYFHDILNWFFNKLAEYAVESNVLLTTNYQKANFIINTKEGDNSNVVDHTTQVLFSKHYMLVKKNKKK